MDGTVVLSEAKQRQIVEADVDLGDLERNIVCRAIQHMEKNVALRSTFSRDGHCFSHPQICDRLTVLMFCSLFMTAAWL